MLTADQKFLAARDTWCDDLRGHLVHSNPLGFALRFHKPTDEYVRVDVLVPGAGIELTQPMRDCSCECFRVATRKGVRAAANLLGYTGNIHTLVRGVRASMRTWIENHHSSAYRNLCPQTETSNR